MEMRVWKNDVRSFIIRIVDFQMWKLVETRTEFREKMGLWIVIATNAMTRSGTFQGVGVESNVGGIVTSLKTSNKKIRII